MLEPAAVRVTVGKRPRRGISRSTALRDCFSSKASTRGMCRRLSFDSRADLVLLAGEGLSQLPAGRDLELGKHPIQVRTDGPVREVQLLPYLTIREPLGRHGGDL
jgi:hypothetical protein